MKYRIVSLFAVLSLHIGCVGLKDGTPSIPYQLPMAMEKEMYKEIQKEKNKCFHIYIIPYDTVVAIYLMPYLPKELKKNSDITYKLVNHTKRKVLVNGKSYPLVFDEDYVFYVNTKDGFPITKKTVKEFPNKRNSKYVSIGDVPLPTLRERARLAKEGEAYFAYRRFSFLHIHSPVWFMDYEGNFLTNVNESYE